MNNNQSNNSNSSTNNSAQNVVDAINQRGRPKTKTSNQEVNSFRLMMHIIKGETIDNQYWLSGYRLGGLDVKRKPRETVRVRLNTVDERVMDEKSFSNGRF